MPSGMPIAALIQMPYVRNHRRSYGDSDSDEQSIRDSIHPFYICDEA